MVRPTQPSPLSEIGMLLAHQRALRLIQSEGRFTMKEIAGVAGCSVSAVHKATSSDGADLSADKWSIIGRYLSEHGETRVSEAFLSPEYEIVRREEGAADGDLNAEIRSLAEITAHLSESHRAKNSPAFDAAILELTRLSSDLKAEGALIR